MHVIDILVVAAFLVATLCVGLRSGKKIKTFSDYAIGNRRFSDFAIFCTLAATFIGGTSIMGNVGKCYTLGITHLMGQVGTFTYFIVAFMLASRFGNYYGCLSIGDMFYKSYGVSGKVLAGILCCIYIIPGLGIQFMAIGTVINVLTGFSYMTCLLIAGSVVLIYTGRGGIRAVTFTDVLQFMVFILVIPMLLLIALREVGGFSTLITQLPKSHLTVSDENLRYYLFLIVPALLLPSLSPNHVQRLLMTSSRQQAKKSYYNLSLIVFFTTVVLTLVGLTTKILIPDLEQSEQVILTLILNYFPVGIFGIAVAGVLAVLMSSADSVLNCGSIILVNDIIIPYSKCVKKKELSEQEKLKWAHVTSILMGIGAILFAIKPAGIFEIKFLSKIIWLPMMLPPLYLLIFNMKISVKGLFCTVAIGLITNILWNIYLKPIIRIDGVFPGFFANVATLFIFYFLGGRQKVFSKEELKNIQQQELQQIKKRPSVREFQVKNNLFLGFCLVFLQLMPLVFDSTSLTYSRLVLTLINGAMAILLIFGGSLEVFKKFKHFKLLKLITLFFCLPITSAFLFLTSAENGLHILTLLLSFIIMVLSIDKRQELKVIFTCCLTALVTVIFYQNFSISLNWPKFFTWQHGCYILGYLTILFLIHSNLKFLQKEKELIIFLERQNLARNLSQDLTVSLSALRLLIDHKRPGEMSEKDYQIQKNIIYEMCGYIDNFIPSSLKGLEFLKPENLNQCITDCIDKNAILYKNVEFRLLANETIFSRVDIFLFRRVVNNLLNICIQALPDGSKGIDIITKQDHLGNQQILFQKQDSDFSNKVLREIFEQNQEWGPKLQFDISFPELKAIVKKWNGKLEIISHNDNASIQILLPNKDHDKIIK